MQGNEINPGNKNSNVVNVVSSPRYGFRIKYAADVPQRSKDSVLVVRILGDYYT